MVGGVNSIFFPKKYDQTSAKTLPLLMTIHGGGFCIGSARDDDEWNRHFANSQGALVVALNYRKAPRWPFPTALEDVEALLLAVLDDESLPIDRTKSPKGMARTAVLGFSAGGNLALAVSQLPTVRSHALAPSASVTVYGCLDLTVPPDVKTAHRHYKTELPAPRGSTSDSLAPIAAAFDWSYIPYGHDLRDPLLSPALAPVGKLSPFVGVVAAELDMLSHEAWTLACRLAKEGVEASGKGPGRRVPSRDDEDEKWRIAGRKAVARKKGALEGVGLAGVDERFAFEERWPSGGVKWLLVPDVMHGFDNPHLRSVMGGGPEAYRDAQMKTMAYVKEMARWLYDVVWEI
jgi:acetyl esterase/lipase